MRHILSLLLCLITLTALSQQRPLNSMYMLDPLLINPAYAGNHVQFSATGIHRNQWVNFPGSPQTSTFSMHSGFWGSRVGIGLILSHETIGVHEDVGLFGQYSYKIFSDAGVLSMGVSAGFNNLRSDFSSLRLIDLNDPNLAGQRSKFNPNFGAGVYWSGVNGLFLGFSAPYLINNKIVDIEGIPSIATQKRNYYLSATKVFQYSPNVTLYPSFLLRMQEGAPITFDLNFNMSFYKVVGLGFSYRNQDAILFLLQLKVLENLHIGYAYDFTLSEIRQYSEGTHEIMFNYRVKLGRIHKGIECPSYY